MTELAAIVERDFYCGRLVCALIVRFCWSTEAPLSEVLAVGVGLMGNGHKHMWKLKFG